MAKLIKKLTVAASALLLAGCNPVKFSGNDSTPQQSPGITPPGPTPTCTTANVESIARLTKIIFLVDTSGSNATATYNPGTCGQATCLSPATDPNKAFRGGAISNFLSTFAHKTNFNWSFATFAQDSAHSLVNSGNDQSPVFAADPNVMQYALNTFASLRDYGNTPYHQALSIAARAIAADPDLNAAANPNYFVILLTDGFPTDYYDSQGNFLLYNMQGDVSSLLAIAPGRVNLSTIYYGLSSDPTAISLLQNMANLGGGQFAAATSTSQFKIDDVIPGSKKNCP